MIVCLLLCLVTYLANLCWYWRTRALNAEKHFFEAVDMLDKSLLEIARLKGVDLADCGVISKTIVQQIKEEPNQ